MKTKKWGLAVLSIMLTAILLWGCHSAPAETTSGVTTGVTTTSSPVAEATEATTSAPTTETTAEVTTAAPVVYPVRVKDLMGREHTIESPVEKVVCIGPAALRMYIYVNGTDKIIGVEEIEYKAGVDRTYVTAYPELKNLPSIGQGGPKNPPNVEQLLEMEPDVIFSMYGMDAAAADELQEKVGKPVLVLSNGKNTLFEQELYDSLALIGAVMGKSERAEELNAMMKGIKEDLAKRTEGVEPRYAYIGGVGFRGAGGFFSTRSQFNLFEAVGVKGYIDEVEKKGPVTLDKEKLIEMDPEVIFIDLNGKAILDKEYAEDPGFFDRLKAVQDHKVYSILSYNNYATNVETAMIDAYYIGKVMYPERFEDVDPAVLAEEIYTKMLGKNVYPVLMEAQKGFQEFHFGE